MKSFKKELPCGAILFVNGLPTWTHGGHNFTVVAFSITDLNQTFSVSEDGHTLNGVAVTREAIPALIRTLQRAYKASGPVSRRKA